MSVELDNLIQLIKNATLPSENTALRVGHTLELLDSEKADVLTTYTKAEVLALINGAMNPSILKIDTIADLRNTDLNEGDSIVLLGYYASGDKKPIIYTYTLLGFDVLVDDGGYIIKTSKGSWFASFNGECDIKDFGAVKDTDCTVIINRALTLVNDVTISDSYKVDPTGYEVTTPTTSFKYTGGVKPRTGTILRCTDKGKIYIDPNNETSYAILNLERVNNVKLIDLNIEGDVSTHLGTTGEGGYGISIKGCEDVDVINCRSNYLWGDGFNVGISKIAADDVNPSRRVNVYRGEFNYCRRNGMSIMSCDGFYGENLVANFNGTINGINPRYGVDIEPNNGGDDVINVEINGLYTEGNSEGGIEFVPAYMQDTRYITPGIFKVKLSNYLSINDGVTTENRGTIRTVFADNTLPNIVEDKFIDGFIDVTNVTIVDSVKRPITFSRVADTGMAIKFTDVKIINPYTDPVAETQRELKNAVSFLTQPTQLTHGMIRIDGLYVHDINNTLITGVFFKPVNGTDKLFKNVIITNYEYEGQWTDTTEVPSYGPVEKSVSVQMSKPVQLSFSATASLHNYSVVDEMEMSITTANTLIALPNSTIAKNKRIKVIAKNPVNTVCYVQGRNDAQPIDINPRNSRVLALRSGSSVTLNLEDNGTWSIVEFSGSIYNDQFPIKGTTALRPTGLSATDNGFSYYDTTIGNYVYWNGTAWVTSIQSTYVNITSNTYNFVPDVKIKTIEVTPTANCVITVKPMTENLTGAIVILRNNANFNVTLLADTGVTIMGTNPYNQVVMNKTRESIILYCNANNSWRTITVNRISDAVTDVAASDATDLPTVITLANELKTKVNAKLLADRNSGQQL